MGNPRLSEYGPRQRRDSSKIRQVKSLNGTVIGNYQIVDLIGKGGFGVVYKAISHLVNREVALKIYRINNDLAFDAFRKGANLLSQVSHPNIVTLYDFLTIKGYAVMVLELLNPGDSLRSYVGTFSSADQLPRFLSIFKEILSAIKYCHQQKFKSISGEWQKGVYHGDIKPDNIFLCKGRVKIMDFMIPDLERFLAHYINYSREEFPDKYATQLYGTPLYMSPEQMRGIVNEQTDIYNIGITAFELISGFYPYESGSDFNKDCFVLLNEIAPETPLWLINIIHRCIAHDLDIRYKHIFEIERDIILNEVKISQNHMSHISDNYSDKAIINKRIEEILRNVLPEGVAMQSENIGQLLQQAINTAILSNQSEVRLTPSRSIMPGLMALKGKEVGIEDTIISFGNNNQFGDIMISDIAKGDIIKITLNINNYLDFKTNKELLEELLQ